MLDEAAPPAPPKQGEIMEKKKRKDKNAVAKRVVQSLMEGSFLLHIIDKMIQMENMERFDESFTAYLELEHYLFAHSKAMDLCQAKAFGALQKARVEIEKVLTEVDYLKKASEIQSAKFEYHRKALRKEEEAVKGLKAALSLAEEKRKKVEEEVDAERERAIKAFKSSKAMKDIKIAFTREAFLEGFEICMERIVKNFLDVNLDLLMDELGKEADPFDAGIISPMAEPTPEAFELAVAAPKSALKYGIMGKALTSTAVAPSKVE
ncbi:hypothetical protein COCNU_11G003370 [Cocos nucifera]|uniref:Uncharacterized protein n=1 Tax=Cocos nucifera TaxID=13894 RepID=A0A8K0IP14_COCNU|nr:hypothetical protein COCNU_11G003370 [Cocos nucifera]